MGPLCTHRLSAVVEITSCGECSFDARSAQPSLASHALCRPERCDHEDPAGCRGTSRFWVACMELMLVGFLKHMESLDAGLLRYF